MRWRLQGGLLGQYLAAMRANELAGRVDQRFVAASGFNRRSSVRVDGNMTMKAPHELLVVQDDDVNPREGGEPHL